MTQPTYPLWWTLLATGLVVAMLACYVAGRHFGKRRTRDGGTNDDNSASIIDGAVFALLGLLVAFTFSGAASRFDDRRRHVLDEANALGTAYLRVALLPVEAQPAVREAFRNYVDARIRTYQLLPDVRAAMAELAKTPVLQDALWTRAVAAAQGSQPATVLLLPALNEAFDQASVRSASTNMHPPPVIFALLIGMALLASGLAGHSSATSARPSWLHAAAFAFVMGGTVYVILDLEFPRLGLIRVDAADNLIIDLRKSMQ